MMQQILYMSVGRDDLDHKDVNDIPTSARRNNPALDLTGLLLFMKEASFDDVDQSSRGVFLQVLEGPHDALDTLLNVIRRDPRHSDVVVLYRKEITQRSFPDWSMGYDGLEQKDEMAGLFALTEQALTHRLPTDGGDEMFELISTFSFVNGGEKLAV